MIKLCSFYFLSCLINLQVVGHYERHNQSCGGMNGSDIKWSLDLKENKTFFLEITKKENDYLSKPKKTLMAGTWRILEDTLKLYQVGESGNPIIFFVNEDKLLFQNKNMMLSNTKVVLPNKDLLYLDYLIMSKVSK